MEVFRTENSTICKNHLPQYGLNFYKKKYNKKNNYYHQHTLKKYPNILWKCICWVWLLKKYSLHIVGCMSLSVVIV